MSDDLNEEDFNKMFSSKSHLSKKEFDANKKDVDEQLGRARDLMLQAMAAAFAKETGLPAERTRLVQEIDHKNMKAYLYFEEK